MSNPASSSPRQTRSTSDLGEDKLRDATFLETIQPGNFFHFCLGMAECWLFSRSFSKSLAAIPFVIILVCGIGGVWWVRHSSMDPVIQRYEEAFNAAGRDGNAPLQETCLKALVSLRPSDPQYTMRLGQMYISQGRLADGYREIIKLAPDNRPGHPDARMWLVKQSVSEKPIQRLSPEEMETQLKQVLDAEPRNADAHQMLARVYVNRREWNLAERHLAEAAGIRPDLNLEVAQLKVILQRPQEDIRAVAERAADALQSKLEANRADDTVRVRLADAWMLANAPEKAREVLVSGLQQRADSELLKTALSNHDLNGVQVKMADSMLNRDVSVPVAAEALKLAPGNIRAIQMIVQLKAIGGKVPDDTLEPAIQHWTKEVEKKPEAVESRVLLSQLLMVAERMDEAASTLEPVMAERPLLRLSRAQLLMKSDKKETALSELESILTTTAEKLKETPDDVATAAIRVEALLTLERFSDAREVLASFTPTKEKTDVPEDAALSQLYGRACIAEFDRLTGFSPGASPESPFQFTIGEDVQTPLNLLKSAIDCPSSVMQGIDRLARLSLSEGPVVEPADAMIRQLRMDNQAGTQALNLLGMHALLMKRYDKAINWLELANSQARSRNPQILNNLAIAIIRGRPGDAAKALTLANQTLELIPDHPDALSTRGEVYLAMEKWNEAVADLTAALDHRSENPLLHRLLEKAYQGMNETSMAQEHATRAATLEATLGPDGGSD
jgi:tetratricopeptide (TPR) repeat protein